MKAFNFPIGMLNILDEGIEYPAYLKWEFIVPRHTLDSQGNYMGIKTLRWKKVPKGTKGSRLFKENPAAEMSRFPMWTKFDAPREFKAYSLLELLGKFQQRACVEVLTFNMEKVYEGPCGDKDYLVQFELRTDSQWPSSPSPWVFIAGTMNLHATVSGKLELGTSSPDDPSERIEDIFYLSYGYKEEDYLSYGYSYKEEYKEEWDWNPEEEEMKGIYPALLDIIKDAWLRHTLESL